MTNYNIIIKRVKYNIYINSFYLIVSKSKITYNSNISLVINHNSIDVSIYISELTQKDDCYNYNLMYQAIKRRLTKVKLENHKSEILFRIMNCILMRNSKNIISSILAKY